MNKTQLAIFGVGFCTGVLAMGAYHGHVLMQWKALNDKHHAESQKHVRNMITWVEAVLKNENLTDTQRIRYEDMLQKFTDLLD